MLMCNICSFYTYTRKWELPYLPLTYSLTTGRTFTYTSACIYRFFPAIFMRRHKPILSTRLVTVSLKFQKLGKKMQLRWNKSESLKDMTSLESVMPGRG